MSNPTANLRAAAAARRDNGSPPVEVHHVLCPRGTIIECEHGMLTCLHYISRSSRRFKFISCREETKAEMPSVVV
jgi:hypothetical protein